MEGYNNQYSYMKSIRFNLEIIEGKFDYDSITLENNFERTEKFIETANNFVENLKNILFQKDKNGHFKLEHNELVFHNTTEIQKRWSKIYCKEYTYPLKEKEIKKKILEVINFLEQEIKNFKELSIKFNNLKKENPRNSEFSFIIKKISSKNIFLFLRDFIKFGLKNKVVYFNLKEDIDNFEIELNLMKIKYLASDSFGIEIARGSINYNTVNKESKKYWNKQEIEKHYSDIINYIKKEKEMIVLNIEYNKLLFNEFDNENYELGNFTLTEKDLSILNKIIEENKIKFTVKNSLKKFNLEESLKLMKIFKSKLKSELIEKSKIKKKENIFPKLVDIKKISFLFIEDIKLNMVLTKTQEIQKNSKNKNKVNNLKIERGNFFFLGKSNKNCFQNWKKFNYIYAKYARKIGEINTKIRNNEKEKYESKSINYWSLLLKQGDEKFVLFVPKQNREKVKNFLKESKNKNSKLIIYSIKSLTKRALDKLCFSEEGTFFKSMENCDKSLFDELKLIKKLKESKEKDKQKLNVYKKILKSDYTNERLDLEYFDINLVCKSRNLDEFEINLEKYCYFVEDYSLNLSELQILIEKNQIIKCKVTSYDLEERNSDEFQTPKSDFKRHTKDFWNKFWADFYGNVRLNPEIRINFKKKDIDLERYLIDKKGLFKEDMINRKGFFNRNLEDKYIITFSFLLNAGKKYSELAFCKTEDLVNKISNFNKSIKKKDLWFYGIDIGESELASLIITKFNRENNEFLRPIFPNNNNKIKCYRLKKDKFGVFEKPSEKIINYEYIQSKGKEIKTKSIISNISYFIDRVENTDWFENTDFFNLNLTCAKVIKGNIIENGDILTYLQYLKKVTKREIFDRFIKAEFNKNNYTLEWKDGDFKNSLYLNDIKIYSFKYKYEGVVDRNGLVYNKIKIEKCFKKYIDDELEKETKIPQLNNLRDALVSNMIGVIFHIQKYFSGYLVLENVPEKNLEDEYIIKRLELALYKKLQTLGLVPPHIKDLVQTREFIEKENNQNFIDDLKKLDLESKKFKDLTSALENRNYPTILNKFEELKNIQDIQKFEKRLNELKFIQIGLVGFVNEAKTSKICPYCDNMKNNKDHINLDSGKKGEDFLCSNCNYNTKSDEDKFKDLKPITNCDNLASYNIAKYFYNNL